MPRVVTIVAGRDIPSSTTHHGGYPGIGREVSVDDFFGKVTLEAGLAIAEQRLADRAERALDNDEMAEHDLLQEAIELLHEAMRTVTRAREARTK